MSLIIEEKGITDSGHEYIVAIIRNSHRCGYVAVKKDSVFYGKDYREEIEELVADPDAEGVKPTPEVLLDVHGGITCTSGEYPEDNGKWWLGFDCAHYGDNEYLGRALPYVREECFSLSKQIKELDK